MEAFTLVFTPRSHVCDQGFQFHAKLIVKRVYMIQLEVKK